MFDVVLVGGEVWGDFVQGVHFSQSKHAHLLNFVRQKYSYIAIFICFSDSDVEEPSSGPANIISTPWDLSSHQTLAHSGLIEVSV